MGGLIAAEPLIRGNVELRLDQAGFTESESSVGGAQPFGLYNASSTAVRVCLGLPATARTGSRDRSGYGHRVC